MIRYPALAAFLATIPLGNWWLDRFGFWHVPTLGTVPSGVVWIGLAFVLRDLAQLLTSKWHVLAAVAAGAGLSWLLADPHIAVASAAAFGLSELLDWCIYTPLADRHFAAAVAVSSFVGGCLDSALFLHLAFRSTHGWWQLAIAKAVVIAAATPVVVRMRRALPRHVTR